MKIDLVTVLNKITTWIKTNGNREITGAQLNEILTDLIENPAQFQLKYGVPVDCIYNTGTFSGDKTRTLLTWQAILNIMGGNKIPIIAPRVIADFPTDINTLHNYSIIANKHLDTGDTVLLSGQTNPAENGLYVIGAQIGDTVRSQIYPDAESLAGIIVTDVTGKMVVCGVDESGDMNVGLPMPEYDGRITAVEENKLDANTPIAPGTAPKVSFDANGLVTASSSLEASDIPSLDAAKITSGTIDIARIPATAIEIAYVYEGAELTPESAGLTINEVQNGDTIKMVVAKKTFKVIDDAKLNLSAGYTEYTTSSDWSAVQNKPAAVTNLSGTNTGDQNAAGIPLTDNFVGNLAGKSITDVAKLATAVDELTAGSSNIPNPITSTTYDASNRVTAQIEDLGSSKTLERRYRYYSGGTNQDGSIDIMEVKDTKANVWKRVTYSYTNGLLTSTSISTIVAWTL